MAYSSGSLAEGIFHILDLFPQFNEPPDFRGLVRWMDIQTCFRLYVWPQLFHYIEVFCQPFVSSGACSWLYYLISTLSPVLSFHVLSLASPQLCHLS